MCPRPMRPGTFVVGRCVLCFSCPLDDASLTDVSRPWTSYMQVMNNHQSCHPLYDSQPNTAFVQKMYMKCDQFYDIFVYNCRTQIDHAEYNQSHPCVCIIQLIHLKKQPLLQYKIFSLFESTFLVDRQRIMSRTIQVLQSHLFLKVSLLCFCVGKWGKGALGGGGMGEGVRGRQKSVHS